MAKKRRTKKKYPSGTFKKLQAKVASLHRALKSCKGATHRKPSHRKTTHRRRKHYREGSFSLIGGASHQRAQIRKEQAARKAAAAAEEAANAARKAARAAMEAGLKGPRKISLNDPSRRRRKKKSSAKKRTKRHTPKRSHHTKKRAKRRTSRDASSRKTRGLRRYRSFLKKERKTWDTFPTALEKWKKKSSRRGKAKSRRG